MQSACGPWRPGCPVHDDQMTVRTTVLCLALFEESPGRGVTQPRPSAGGLQAQGSRPGCDPGSSLQRGVRSLGEPWPSGSRRLPATCSGVAGFTHSPPLPCRPALGQRPLLGTYSRELPPAACCVLSEELLTTGRVVPVLYSYLLGIVRRSY